VKAHVNFLGYSAFIQNVMNPPPIIRFFTEGKEIKGKTKKKFIT
jgi:hypothetical protein